ncbi:MAG: MarR family winged helix-turn-helix transcriptional regulator [Rhodococcus sp. (in: high G+C Gram-positive bacteria)]
MDSGLSDDRARTWLAYRRMHQVLITNLDRQLARDSGMPPGYYAVLAALANKPDHRLLLSELARECNFSQSRLSHAIARMEESGWVVREPSEDSRRSTYARLTDNGVRARSESAVGHNQAVRELFFDGLTTDEEHQLRDLFDRISDHMASIQNT